MTTIQNFIDDVGRLIAGTQQVKNGKTLREVKPKKYAPTSDFGKWLEGTVNSAIKNAKRKALDDEWIVMLFILRTNEALIPVAQDEVERLFIETFGAEKVQSNVWLDKVLGNSKITKLCVLAKENGVNDLEVERVRNAAVRSVLEVHGLI